MKRREPLRVRVEQYFPESFPPVLLELCDYTNRQTEVEHFHDFYELVYVRAGTGNHVTGEQAYPIHMGDIFLVKPGVVHTYQGIADLQLANFLFLPDRMGDYLRPLQEIIGYYVLFEVDMNLSPELRFKGRRSMNLAQMQKMEDDIHAMLCEQTERIAGWRGMVILQFLQMLTTLCRIFSSVESRRCQENIRISEVIRYLESHFENPVTLPELARVYGRSVPQFQRAFRMATGQSPIQYLLRFRLKKAASLLRESADPIMEIAALTGFSDSNYFTKMFSREFGKSPRHYRKT